VVPTGHAQDWDDLAALDPMWAIVSADGTRGGRWDPALFHATGRQDVERLLSRADELGVPRERRRVLDVGCGLGRHAPALAAAFDSYLGVDISPRMVEAARELHRDLGNARFETGDAVELPGLDPGAFDLVTCQLVLIHLPTEADVKRAVARLVEVLAPGGLLLFQIADRLRARNRIQPRRRAYHLLRVAGVPPSFLFERLKLDPIRMTRASPGAVAAQVQASGGRLLARVQGGLGPEIKAVTLYVTR
jgi:SAM-dependent methyltransferase